MDNEILENHQKYLDRKVVYKSFGYDVDQERSFVLDQAKPVRGRILEAGTGKGHFAFALAKAGYTFVTFDISPEEQRLAKLNIGYAGLEQHVEFKIENGEHTSFEDGSFDTIFSVNVLHHLRDPYQVLDEFVRILAPAGTIVLSDFTPEGFTVMDKIHRLEGTTHEVGKTGLADAHVYLEAKGFSVKRTKSVYQCVLIAGRGCV
ncbi:MAG: class I SAM-dependent methyltransferase [Candidatus Omnitrophica bacterium]|nr:class I SAM-dependent methyltransferase [Candidatus Omnitrophota bacterium]